MAPGAALLPLRCQAHLCPRAASLLLLPLGWEWNWETQLAEGRAAGVRCSGFPTGPAWGGSRSEVNTYRNAKHVPIPTDMSRTAILCVYATLCLDRNSGFPRASPYYSAAPTAPRVFGAQISPKYPAHAQALRGLQPDRPSCPSAQGGYNSFPQITKSNAFHIHICFSNLGNILKICHLGPSTSALPAPPRPSLPVATPPWSPRLLPARGLSGCLHQAQPPGNHQWHLPPSGPATAVRLGSALGFPSPSPALLPPGLAGPQKHIRVYSTESTPILRRYPVHQGTPSKT